MSKSRKKCSSCERSRLVKFFSKNSSKRDGLQSNCKDCAKAKFKDYYRDNWERHRASVRRRKYEVLEEAREVVFDHLSTHPCVDCGETNQVLLEFDHVRGKKHWGIAQMLSDFRPVAQVRDEIAKCDVRCVSCHTLRTARERRYWVWQRLHAQ